MVAVLRGNDDVDSAHWPALTQDLLTAAGAASTAVDQAVRRFQVAHVYVECDETGNPLLTHHSGGEQWVNAYSRPEWVPGVDTGQDVDLLSLTGVELTRRLPPGTGLRLDPGQVHGLVVVPAVTLSPGESIEDTDSSSGAVR
jgi:hypothetical protein